MTDLKYPVFYLDFEDFTPSGKLKHFTDRKCIIMVQANFCGHCSTSKPAFQKFANENKEIVCMTIQGDSNRGGDKLMDIVSKLKPSFQGFPDYLLFNKGVIVNKTIKGRTENDLKEFIF